MYNTSNSGQTKIRGDKMKNNFFKMLKSRGFYLSLLTGVIAVFALAYVYISSQDAKKQNLPDLNQVAEATKDTDKVASNPSTEPAQEANQDSAKDKNDKNSNEETKTGKDNVLKENPEKNNDMDVVDNTGKKDSDTKTKDSKKDDSVAVVNQKKDKITLSFDQETGLAWPIKGDVIKKYSMDKVTYFETLGQYKVNDALIIAATEGMEVKSAVKGVISSIEEDEETGITVTVDIGDGYQVVYGQLKDVTKKKGSTVKAGEVIGSIAKPTKYYSVEGTNLYLKVLQDEEPINPLLLLR